MSTQEDRIKLAEAMGVLSQRIGSNAAGEDCWSWNPFTDANDDYAVLEWMIAQGLDSEIFKEACLVMLTYPAYRYKIGDYARAALKVIDSKELT